MNCKPGEGKEGQVLVEARSYDNTDCSDEGSVVELAADTCQKIDASSEVYLFVDCSAGKTMMLQRKDFVGMVVVSLAAVFFFLL
jgi:hypothetical protein